MKGRLNNLIMRYENKYSMLKQMGVRSSETRNEIEMIKQFIADLRALKE